MIPAGKGKDIKDKLDVLLYKQLEDDLREKRYTSIKTVLKLVATGALISGSILAPNLMRILNDYPYSRRRKDTWRKFNIPYLKRSLQKLEKQRLIQSFTKDNDISYEITRLGTDYLTDIGIDSLALAKPAQWNGKYWIVSYDIPNEYKKERGKLREYLKNWNFFPLHESMFLHAYPCLEQIDLVRNYLSITEFVRIFIVDSIENDRQFREFFDV